jgi:membrane fusion protein (multidrug efflux system)
MKSKKKFYILLVSITAVLIILAVNRISRSMAESTKRPQIVPSVKVAVPQRRDMTVKRQFTGDVAAIQSANIYSKVNGNIEKMFVDIGEPVQQNQLLAVIDTAMYSQTAKQAYASLLQAEANVRNAALLSERNKSLLDQNLISKQDYDNAKTAYELALAQKEYAAANLKNTQTQLNYCKVTAPFAGFITKRFLDPGAYVTATAPQATSTLFTLMDLHIVKIIMYIPEKEIASLKYVREVAVSIDALPGRIFTGAVSKINQAIDLATRTLAVEVIVKNPSYELKPGMFATIEFVAEKKSNVLALPLEAVLSDYKGAYVFVPADDSTARKAGVQTGIRDGGFVELTDGVNEEMKVVVVGQGLLKDKAKIRILK